MTSVGLRIRRRSQAFTVSVWALFAVLAAMAPSTAQVTAASETPDHDGVIEITREGLREGLALDEGWRFFPDVDDSGETQPQGMPIDPILGAKDLTEIGWSGSGRFELQLHADPDLALAALSLLHEGASEIYLDGDLLARYGVVSPDPGAEEPYFARRELVLIPLQPGTHRLVVRYSNHADYQRLGGVGFRLLVGEQARLAAARETLISSQATEVFLVTGAALALAILHAFLFAFFPRELANLLYAAMTLSLAGLYLTDQRAMFSSDPAASRLWFDGTLTFGLLLPLLGAWFASFAVGGGASLYLRSLGVVAAVLTLWIWIDDGAIGIIAVTAFELVAFAEMVRILGVAVWRRRTDAWIMMAGLLIFLVASFGGALAGLGRLAVTVGALLFLASMSAYLARRVARVHMALEARLAEVEELGRRHLEQERRAHAAELESQLLAVENQRKTNELEQARDLQLSMLPARAPETADWEVAWRMWTATEVGGDYYDTADSSDGRGPLLAVGDATGHGLDAGLLVTATKSLFQTGLRDSDLPSLLERISVGLRRLRLRRRNVALLVARLEAGQVRVAASGMPPLLVHRHATGEVEEMLLAGLPLGTALAPNTNERIVELRPADTLLITSDGLPELPREDGEPWGYERLRRAFRQAVQENDLKTLIEGLYLNALAWADRTVPEDDVTLVALRRSRT